MHRKSAGARLERSQLQGRVARVRAKKAVGSAIRGVLKAQGIKLGKVSGGGVCQTVRAVVTERVGALEETQECVVHECARRPAARFDGHGG